MKLPINQTASRLETIAGNFVQSPKRYLTAAVENLLTKRGVRLGAKLHSLFETIAIDRELAGIHDEDVITSPHQYVTISSRSASLTRPSIDGTTGDIEWIRVDGMGVSVGEASDIARTHNDRKYSPNVSRDRALARACLRVLSK